MEFAQEGGEGPTPVRGPPARGDGRRQHAVHAPGQRRGDLADHGAADRASTAGAPLRARHLGAEGGRPSARRRRPLARDRGWRHERDRIEAAGAAATDGRRRQGAQAAAPRPIQSAAAPSPFPPIADYAFLSDCHTGALVAPDGSIDWLCVPRFDSPERVRLAAGPRGRAVPPRPVRHRRCPSARHYEPGHQRLVTTWKTPGGWVEVREALTMGPTTREDTITPHTRPPDRRGRRPHAGADGQLPRGRGRDRARLRAGVRLRPHPGRVDAGRRQPPYWPTPPAPARRSGCRPTSSSGSRSTASAPGTRSGPARRPSSRCRGRTTCAAPPRTSRTPATARRHRRGSGDAGSGARARSPTTAGARRSSARR